ncbi:MAG: hypothetical protein J0L75_05565, partial [Spirochaetes bacterium]|nr:hypothetical protein [Spirochaetota bacterium]
PLLRAGLSGGRPALAALATAWDQGFLHRLFLQQFLVILTFGVAMLALDGPPSRRFLLESIAMAVYGAARIALEWQLSREG